MNGERQDNQEDRPAKQVGGRFLHPLDWARQAGAFPDVLTEMEGCITRRRRRRLALTATLAAMALVAAIGWQNTVSRRSLGNPNAGSLVVHGAPQTRVLQDGSIVELRQDCTVAVDYSAGVRRVALQRGEAHFQVMKDPSRPFIVEVAGVAVRAVGTAFAVQKGASAVQVVVTEGRVVVEQADESRGEGAAGATPASHGALALIDKGASAVVAVPEGGGMPRARVYRLSGVEISERLAWRVPVLELTGTPLAEVAVLVGRHAGVKFVFGDRTLGALKFSGLLRADNVDTLLKLLEEDHGVQVVRRTGDEIVLDRRH